MKTRLRCFLFNTLRGRLILGVALVHAVMMTLFIADLTLRQRDMLLDRQAESSMSLSRSLATSAAGWIVAHDIAGMQELVDGQRAYPELLFAMLVDEDGRVLAHTDPNRRGLYLQDLPRDFRETVMTRNEALVDVAVPARLGGRHVGWARVGIGQKAAGRKLAQITFNGMLYVLAAMGLGSGIAWWVGRRLTQRLYLIQESIAEVRAGRTQVRSHLTGEDEAAIMAREFNTMLDTLEERDRELRESQERVLTVLNSLDAMVYVADMNTYEVLYVNEIVKQLFGDITGQICWQSIQAGQTGPCAFCSNPHLLDADGNPGAVYRWELKNTRDGHWYDIHDRAIRWMDGRLVRLEIATDITERKQAETSLRKSQETLEKIFAMTTFCLAYMDREFNFIRVNRRYAEADGKQPEDFIGKNHFDLYPSPVNEAIFRRVLETGETYLAQALPFEYRNHPERGTTYWDWSLAPVMDSSGAVEALIISLVNVTDRIKAQRELGKLNEELEERVRERTAALESKNAELARLNRHFVGRELRMVELKERIAELERELVGKSGIQA